MALVPLLTGPGFSTLSELGQSGLLPPKFDTIAERDQFLSGVPERVKSGVVSGYFFLQKLMY